MIVIIVNPLFPVTWVVLSAILVLGLLGWLEVKRNQKLLSPRLVALLLAVFSIVCLILDPSLSVKKTSDIIVLTPNYSNEILDSLLNINSNSQLYKLKGVTGAVKAEEIQNYRALDDLTGNIFILGDGVPQYMLEYTDTSSLQYLPSSLPEGFTGISTNKTYTANQRGEIKGIVTLKDNQTITLTGPGAVEDSIRVNVKSSQPFSLSFTPKAAGLYVYTLTASDSSRKIQYSEKVPVQVNEQNPLSILFVSDYPSAEIRFLKNFLERKNHKLTLRYKISKDKYRTEFVNTPQTSIGRLNKGLLQRFDLILTDATSLTSLTGIEIQTLKEAMNDGLGILTLIHTSTFSKQVNDLLAFKLIQVKSDSAQLFVNKQRLKLSATPVTASSERNLFHIQREFSGRIVSGYYLSGLGKSGFQLLTNTFSLALSGEKEAYAEIWAPLIEAVARKEIKKYDVSFTAPFPYYPDEPVGFKIIGGDEKPTIRIDAQEIPIIEDPLIRNIWYGKIWAGEIGWNSLTIDQDSSQYNFFVSQPEGWRSLQVSNQQKNISKVSSIKGHTVEHVLFQPVPRVIFFLLFLISAGFLWLAPKL